MSKLLSRDFVIPGKEPLPDPAPSLSVPEVQGLLAQTYPELTNAKYTEKIENERLVIRFEASYGTKG